MPYVKSFDGTKIYYEVKGEGTPLILIPSCGVTLDYWKYQDPLALKYKLVKIDVAGIGKSERTRKEYTYPSLGEDVKAVIEKEQLDKVVILGLGMGGAIALEAAILLKDKMLGIISVDSLLPGTVYYGKKATEEEITEVMDLYKGNYQDYYDNLLRDMLGDRVSPELIEWFVEIAGYKINDPAILREMVRIMLPHDYHNIIDQVPCPIKYLLRGRYRTVDYVLEEQKNARFIDNVGHNSNFEDPETFNRIVDELMQELLEKK
ncbi:MAG: alpha/beta hydrolase [Candidatus Heimdallarchaeota archaeon]|nr:alpha/beta hydrolase [Candidatus Heimdallarchaeota archaeon]